MTELPLAIHILPDGTFTLIIRSDEGRFFQVPVTEVIIPVKKVVDNE